MKRKLTPFDYALWAALPMAHTSKIEGRLTLILDKTRRRTLPHRTLFLALAVGGAVLVPLAMLRPAAQARRIFRSSQGLLLAHDQFEIVGVRDVNVHHTDRRWWGPNGKILPGAVYSTEPFQFDKDLFSSADVKNLCFVFQSPDKSQDKSAVFAPSGALTYTANYQKAQWRVTASFPSSAKTTNITVGTATGPWAKIVWLRYHHGEQFCTDIQGFTRHAADLDLTAADRIVFSLPAGSLHNRSVSRVITVSASGLETRLPQNVAIKLGGGETVTVELPHVHPRLRLVRIEFRPYTWQVFNNIALQSAQKPQSAKQARTLLTGPVPTQSY